ncbi:hypothetical protein Tco_0760408 [Tanacetum coccineum]
MSANWYSVMTNIVQLYFFKPVLYEMITEYGCAMSVNIVPGCMRLIWLTESRNTTCQFCFLDIQLPSLITRNLYPSEVLFRVISIRNIASENDVSSKLESHLATVSNVNGYPFRYLVSLNILEDLWQAFVLFELAWLDFHELVLMDDLWSIGNHDFVVEMYAIGIIHVAFEEDSPILVPREKPFCIRARVRVVLNLTPYVLEERAESHFQQTSLVVVVRGLILVVIDILFFDFIKS